MQGKLETGNDKTRVAPAPGPPTRTVFARWGGGSLAGACVLQKDSFAQGKSACATQVRALDSRIIRPPAGNGFLDVAKRQLFLESALDQSRQLLVRGEAQADELLVREFADPGAQRLRQDGYQPQPFFQADHAVLHAQGVDTETDGGNRRRQRQKQQPEAAHIGMPKQVDSHGDEICYQERQQEEMERWIVLGVVGKILR